jgi:hypothetical protein
MLLGGLRAGADLSGCRPKRYAGSIVREKPKAEAAKTAAN